MKINKIKVIFSSHLGDEKNKKFIAHISKTIGHNHEAICIENYNQFSLSEIYNEALQKYRTDDSILVFCHPDITFKTHNWGKLLINHFKNTNYGIIGVAGTTYLPKNGKWWSERESMIGIVEHTNKIRTWENRYSDPFNGVKPTVMIDGLFMAVNPSKLVHGFDEKYGKFHFYDLGFCVPNYLDGVDVGVMTNIRIIHESVGITNDDWERNRILFEKEYESELPIAIPPTYKDINTKLVRNPKVSIIIPTKDNPEILINNLNSWKSIVNYPNYEIIVADTGSNDETFKKYLDYLPSFGNRIKLIQYNYFNFAKINNDVVKNHVSDDTELILFCNDDVELLNDALTRCVEIYNQNKKNVGTIGIRLHYEDSRVQHCGIEIHRNEDYKIFLTHKDSLKISNYSDMVLYDVLGNTGAFLLINKDLFLKFNGFNESYIDCLEDVELNLQCVLDGKENITVCDAVAYHYESLSRNRDKNKSQKILDDLNDRLYPFYLSHKDKIEPYVYSHHNPSDLISK